MLGGVCAGLARRLGIEPLPVRIIALVLALAGGIGVPLYLLAWAAMPGDSSARGLGRSRRSAVEVALGVGLLAISAMLALRGMGLWISDAVTWPLALVAGGVALVWRGGIGARPAAPAERTPVAAVPAPVEPAARVANVSRQGLGAALLVAAGLVFLQATGSLSAARDVILAALVVAAVLALIFAPWTLRMARSLTVERAERIRSQERAELAAHLHDSVLQTLALMQKRADDPREVAALARAQERELRAWLAGRSPAEGERSLAAALEAAAADVEQRPPRARRRRSPSATPTSTPRARRSSPPRARRWSTRRSSARAPRSRSTRRRRRRRCRSSSAIAAPASIPRRGAGATAVGCASPSWAAWRATAAARR